MIYENFPLVLFFRLMQKGDAVVNRAIAMKRLPLSPVSWRKIKMQWELNHEDEKGENYLEAKKKVVTETIQYNKTRILIEWMKKTKLDTKELFEACRFPWSEDKKERVKTLNKQLNKANQRLKIFEAQLAKLNEGKGEDEEMEEFSMATLNESIASLEYHGATIPDYEKFTLGQYDAWTLFIRKKNEKEQIKQLD